MISDKIKGRTMRWSMCTCSHRRNLLLFLWSTAAPHLSCRSHFLFLELKIPSLLGSPPPFLWPALVPPLISVASCQRIVGNREFDGGRAWRAMVRTVANDTALYTIGHFLLPPSFSFLYQSLSHYNSRIPRGTGS